MAGLVSWVVAENPQQWVRSTLDSCSRLYELWIVGLDRSRPALAKAFRPSAALRPLAGPGAYGDMQDHHKSDFGGGIGASNVQCHC
jgi:hypothetical protein